MRKVLLSLLFFSLFPLYSFAQQDTPIQQVMASEIEELNQKDEERNEDIANLLGFTIPRYTDNPSIIITFKDPSPNGSGIEIDIDETSFNKITSPYTFPALSIGNHVVKFRFNDESDTVKVLEYDLTVVPRAPITDTPTVGQDSISISGTALANSDVIYTLSSNAFNTTDTITVNSDGTWSTTIAPEGGLSEGIYTFTSYARKYGYASTLSSPVTFTVGALVSDDTSSSDSKEIYFSFSSLNMDNVSTVLKQNPDLIYLLVGVFFFTIVFTIFFRNILFKSSSEKKIKEVEKLIMKDNTKSEDGNKTLREIFGGEKVDEKEEDEKEKEEKSEGVKKETIINKDVFLKKYKMVDPDDTTGKEVKKKNKVKISLTSKEES